MATAFQTLKHLQLSRHCSNNITFFLQRSDHIFGNSGNRSFKIEMRGCYGKGDSLKNSTIKVEFKKAYQTVLLNVDGNNVIGTAVSKHWFELYLVA